MSKGSSNMFYSIVRSDQEKVEASMANAVAQEYATINALDNKNNFVLVPD